MNAVATKPLFEEPVSECKSVFKQSPSAVGVMREFGG